MRFLSPERLNTKQDYDRNGFVVIRSLLTEREVSELRFRAMPHVEKLERDPQSDDKYYNVSKSLHKSDTWFQQQLSLGKHCMLIRDLLEQDIVGVSAAIFYRAGGDHSGIDPHIDAIGRDAELTKGATIWFPLDKVDKSNGCLHYLMRSHLDAYPNMIPIPGIQIDSEDVFAAELRPGDAVIHNARTIHWSGGNSSEQPRRAVSFFYFAADHDG